MNDSSQDIARDEGNGKIEPPTVSFSQQPETVTLPQVHPAATVFPEMSGEELQDLAEDIKKHGLLNPITRDATEVILDGRNRWRACAIAGIVPSFQTYEGIDPIGFIVSQNLKRRQLNESQRAMIANKLATLELGDNQHTNKGGSANLPTQAVAAAMFNISERSVRDARVVQDHGSPELVREVEQGKTSVSKAAKKVRPPRKRKTKPPKPPLREVVEKLKGELSTKDKEICRLQAHIDDLEGAREDAAPPAAADAPLLEILKHILERLKDSGSLPSRDGMSKNAQKLCKRAIDDIDDSINMLLDQYDKLQEARR